MESVKTADAHQAKALLSALAAAAQEVMDRDGAVRQELSKLDRRQAAAAAESAAAVKKLQEAREEQDAVKNVISGYTLRLDGRKKKAEQARERHVRLKMDENALISRIRMLREMEKLHEGTQGGEAGHGGGPEGDPAPHPRPSGRTAPCAGPLHSGHRDRSGGRDAKPGGRPGGGWQGGHPVSEAAGRRPGHPSCPSAPSGPASCGRAGSLSREPGFVGVADQLVQFDPQYRAVFSNLLGRVAVMEDLDTAIAPHGGMATASGSSLWTARCSIPAAP